MTDNSTQNKSITSQSMDLSIFQNIQQQPDENHHDFRTNISIRRLLCALKYYTMLDVIGNEQDQDKFIHFIKEIYTTQILDDYYHLTKFYNDDLEDIMEYAKTTLNIKSVK